VDHKKLYIIGGCNGAGKTTASFKMLPDILDCKEYVNADQIARGIPVPMAFKYITAISSAK
jgi:predicted ABC-type ATPase